MKRIAFILFLFPMLEIAKAQPAPVLPSENNMIDTSHAHILINNYQNSTRNHHPSSFIINATDLKNYFSNARQTPNIASNDWYLHIYLATDNDENLRLIIVPSLVITPNPMQPQNIIFEHDPLYQSIFVANAWEPNVNGFCYVSDALDGIDKFSNTCTLSIQSSQVPIGTSSNPSVYDQWIQTYETDHTQNVQLKRNHIQSFTFNANSLKNYIMNNSVPFLQLYLGLDKNIQPNPEHYNTIIFVGLDANGNHMLQAPSAIGAYPCVFEECKPCPICGIATDSRLPDAIVNGVLQEQLFPILESRYELLKTQSSIK